MSNRAKLQSTRSSLIKSQGDFLAFIWSKLQSSREKDVKGAEKFEKEISYLIEQAEELEDRQTEKEQILTDVSNVDRETKAG